jgi:RNA-directed DNA polymerase
MEGVSQFITGRLKLKVNESKSAVARPEARKFLGFSSHRGNPGKAGKAGKAGGPGKDGKAPKAAPPVKRRIAPKAVERFKAKVRELTNRHKGRSLRQVVKPLSEYLRGWRGYFGFTQWPHELRPLDEWVRRRLRCLVWTHWGTGRRRFAELSRRGVDRDTARMTAGSRRGPWCLSRTPALQVALPNAFWDWIGVERVLPRAHV